jgi:hypothetical protein
MCKVHARDIHMCANATNVTESDLDNRDVVIQRTASTYPEADLTRRAAASRCGLFALECSVVSSKVVRGFFTSDFLRSVVSFDILAASDTRAMTSSRACTSNTKRSRGLLSAEQSL